MSNFRFFATNLSGLMRIEVKTFGDPRGYFREIYQQGPFHEAGITAAFVQDNVSHSRRGILRGLHFQKPPMIQGKLVCVTAGEVFDVAVDLRPHSPTFTEWFSLHLTAEKGEMLYIPPGFAHGFQVLSETATFSYKVTAPYSPEHEGGVAHNDPDLAIPWPLAHPEVSERDQRLPHLHDISNLLHWE